MIRGTTQLVSRSSKFRICKASLLASAASLILLIAPSPASADFIQSASGNSRGGTTSANIDGTANFAVLDRDDNPDFGTDTNDTWGTGLDNFDLNGTFPFTKGTGSTSPVLDTGADFLYLYQFVNDGVNTDKSINSITDFLNGFDSTEVTSWGYWADLGLADGAQVEVDSTNPFGSAGAFGNTAPAATGVTTPSVVDISASADVPQAPTAVFLDGVTDAITFDWDQNKILDTERSVLVGFTSNLSPTFITATLTDSVGTNPLITIPTLAPLPPAIVMLLAGAPFALLSLLRRRRNKH